MLKIIRVVFLLVARAALETDSKNGYRAALGLERFKIPEMNSVTL